jgi:predicted transposase YdaD
MADKRYDVSVKDLIEDYATAWPELIGAGPHQGVDVIDADISTVTGAADKALLVHGEAYDWILNLEVQAGHRLNVPDRLHLKSTLFHHRHGLPVRSAVVLLRRAAEATNLSGIREERLPDSADPYDVFRYLVVRVWRLPLGPLLSGSLGLLPLALLTDEAAPIMPQTVARIEARLRQQVSPEAAEKLRTVSYILLGLRYPQEFIENLFHGVTSMEESVTYQAILAKGEAKGKVKGIEEGKLLEARGTLLRLGRKRWGPPDAAITEAIMALIDLARLEALQERVSDVSSWSELLA